MRASEKTYTEQALREALDELYRQIEILRDHNRFMLNEIHKLQNEPRYEVQNRVVGDSYRAEEEIKDVGIHK